MGGGGRAGVTGVTGVTFCAMVARNSIQLGKHGILAFCITLVGWWVVVGWEVGGWALVTGMKAAMPFLACAPLYCGGGWAARRKARTGAPPLCDIIRHCCAVYLCVCNGDTDATVTPSANAPATILTITSWRRRQTRLLLYTAAGQPTFSAAFTSCLLPCAWRPCPNPNINLSVYNLPSHKAFPEQCRMIMSVGFSLLLSPGHPILPVLSLPTTSFPLTP